MASGLIVAYYDASNLHSAIKTEWVRDLHPADVAPLEAILCVLESHRAEAGPTLADQLLAILDRPRPTLWERLRGRRR